MIRPKGARDRAEESKAHGSRQGDQFGDDCVLHQISSLRRLCILESV
jgi:hypothetical protein